MIGLENKPYLCHEQHVDTDYLHNNRENVIKAIANCGLETWSLTGKPCNVLETVDKKHFILKTHASQNYDLTDIKNKQIFEQLYFKIYNVGHFKYLKFKYEYTDTMNYFSFMQGFIESLPFSKIREILLMVLPAGVETLVHKDPAHLNTDRFIYLRPNLDKPFFVYDENNEIKHYVKSTASEWNWLDWHGADASNYATYAFKVKGDLNV
jgi:hypothetical protein